MDQIQNIFIAVFGALSTVTFLWSLFLTRVVRDHEEEIQSMDKFSRETAVQNRRLQDEVEELRSLVLPLEK